MNSSFASLASFAVKSFFWVECFFWFRLRRLRLLMRVHGVAGLHLQNHAVSRFRDAQCFPVGTAVRQVSCVETGSSASFLRAGLSALKNRFAFLHECRAALNVITALEARFDHFLAQ